jgi:hypothetical protein
MTKTRGGVLLGAWIACAIVMLALQTSLRQDWVPFRALAHAPIIFLHYRFAHAQLWWLRVAGLYVLWFLVLIGCMFYARTIGAALGGRFLPVLLAIQALGLGVMIASPLPMDSDQFAYVYYASLTERGVNPYEHQTHPLSLTPNEIRIAPAWGNPPFVDRYGAGWTLANAALLAPLRGASVELQARVLRIAASLAALLSTVLLWIGLRGFAWRHAALIAFSLNPLVISATGNGGHNDIYTVLLGLAAYLLAGRRYYELAACMLAVSVQVKFAYAPFLLPLLAVVFVMTRSWLRTVLTAVAFAATVLAFSIPLTISRSLVDVALALNAGHLPQYTYMLWRVFYHVGLAHVVTKPIAALFFPMFTALCALGIAILALRRRREPLLELVLFISLLLLPYKVENWYGIMLTPMLFIPRPWAPAAFIGVTAASELMLRRMFMYSDNPVAIATLLGVAVGAAVWYVIKSSRLGAEAVAGV